jgi:hypothetical protein
MDIIWRERELSYFTEDDDAAVARRSLELLARDEYDVLVSYQQGYDEWLHQTQPRSPECLAEMRRHIDDFVRLASAARQRWAGRPHALAFLPDHGSHIDPATGLGTHGEDIPEDMELTHFWAVNPRG